MVVHKFNRLININTLSGLFITGINVVVVATNVVHVNVVLQTNKQKITANEIMLFFSYNPRKYGGVNQKERKEEKVFNQTKKKNRPIEFYHLPKVNSSFYIYIFNLPHYLFILTILQFNHHHYNCTIILLITFYRTKELQATKN